jgi:hypothetical protein
MSRVYYDEVAVTSFTSFIGATIMKTEIRKFVAALSALGLLVIGAESRAVEVENVNMTVPAQNTRASANHGGIARQYENNAKELMGKAEERKKLIQHYEDKSYLYGRGGQDFQAQAIALERKYKLASEKATRLAAFHYKMASGHANRDFVTSPRTSQQVSSR